jgi:hypothetical protein
VSGRARRVIRSLRVEEPPKTKHLWSIGIYRGASPLTLSADPALGQPVLSRDDVTDVRASFVADPFLVRDGLRWSMFFEVLNLESGRGEIGLATSEDLAAWHYQQIVLSEPFHLSYPFVFEWEGERYMIPETHQTRSIRLYKADPFPLKWRFVQTLLSGERYADTTVFHHGGRWWLFTETSAEVKHDTLRLFSSDSLAGQWVEHPASPIVSADAHTARPAGRIVRTASGLLRFAQDCAPRYGLSVNAFEITTLTEREYVEVPVRGNPILAGSGAGWNEAGMHHVDAHELSPDRWIAAVDGWQRATKARVERRA